MVRERTSHPPSHAVASLGYSSSASLPHSSSYSFSFSYSLLRIVNVHLLVSVGSLAIETDLVKVLTAFQTDEWP